MKRDFDVIREILLEVESRNRIDIPSSRTEIRSYHGELLIKERYAESGRLLNTTTLTGLTWKGHDLLDSIRDDKVWSKTKIKLLEVGGSASLSVVKAIAEMVMKEGLNLG